MIEDEIFVAIEIESVVEELGCRPAGIASDAQAALSLADQADIALVDLNLRDGPTGPEIGRQLAQRHGLTVLYMTANPSQLGDRIPGTLGVTKPVMDDELRQAVSFAGAIRENRKATAPARMTLFEAGRASVALDAAANSNTEASGNATEVREQAG